jgi:hypothetical protein
MDGLKKINPPSYDRHLTEGVMSGSIVDVDCEASLWWETYGPKTSIASVSVAGFFFFFVSIL